MSLFSTKTVDEPAAPFRIGERVRIGGCGDSSLNGRIGDIGRCYRNRERPGHWLVHVEWFDGARSWCMVPAHCVCRLV